ncbi:hypothetical protein LCGC14_2066540 [marine sediment metagenome]|uniref:Uncharacterized protein n=1 Tax=marine sediment metagenome TaxID=412755 RepID=A0A0F9F736_9ZZZZ
MKINWKKILCDWLGWHKVKKIGMIGFGQIIGDCERCGKKNLLLDSQGGWF